MTGVQEWPDDTLAPWKIIIFNVTGQLSFPDYWNPCGGTLLDSTTILTTASCFHNNGFSSENYHNGTFIFAGDKRIRQLDFVQIVDIIYPIAPNGFERKSFGTLNNIAIVKLDKALALKSNSQLACLPDPNDYVPENNTKCFIGKWRSDWSLGLYLTKTHFQNNISFLILANDSGMKFYWYPTRIICRDKCRKIWGKSHKITSNMICTEELPGGCMGSDDFDVNYSGEPLVCLVGNVPKIVGLSSRGTMCAVNIHGGNERPKLFTRVEKYYDWIKLAMVICS